MNALCETCHSLLDVPKIFDGLMIECPVCHSNMTPQHVSGSAIPATGTGYEISYHDFQNLFTHPPSRNAVAELLKTWFGYEVEEGKDGFRIRGNDADVVLLFLHVQLQSDPDKQVRVYNAAMRHYFW